MTDTVLVTGATGFLAQHCIVALLKAGYTVRGTVRKADAGARVKRNLLAALGDDFARVAGSFSAVEADLERDEGWLDAARSCRYVLHVASPIPSEVIRREEDLIRPAREGTLRVLKAALAAGVKRVVLTSSISAVISRNVPHKVFNESHWSDISAPSIGAYDKSKHLAERAAWEFVRNLPPDRALELAVINPGLLLGPVFGGAVSTSGLVVKKLLGREYPACPDLHFAVVDVRDVAAAHVRAMTDAQAAGQRFICAVRDISTREIAKILHDRFAKDGFAVPTRHLPKLALRVFGLFDKPSRLALQYVGRPELIDNSKIKRVLGWTPRPIEETIVAMGASLIEQGVVRPQVRPGAAAPERAATRMTAWRNACANRR